MNIIFIGDGKEKEVTLEVLLESFNDYKKNVIQRYLKNNPETENLRVDYYCNINCINCRNCEECEDCSYCYDCYKCEGCHKCVDCNSCKNCDFCYKCWRCKNCAECYDCTDIFQNDEK